MSEEKALAMSTGYFQDGRIGFLPFEAANFLVGTGRYQFETVGFFGYVISKVKR